MQETPSAKTARAKWTGGVVQAVERLLCKLEALNSNLILIPQKRKKIVFHEIFYKFCVKSLTSGIWHLGHI
jgi:hypothetical protein